MKKLEEFIMRNIAGENILVPVGATTQKFNGMISLSETAAFIWENLEKCEGIEDMVDLMLEEFEIDRETAEKDTKQFIDELKANGFIE
ncbi:MAG: PqqD family protein [Eubacteriales bacterium]|nr:PqqD family protein [Eubacteriales bacterium]